MLGRKVSRRLHVLSSALAVAAPVGGACAPSAGAGQTPVVKPTQEVATLVTAHEVLATLNGSPSSTSTVPAWRPITGEQTVLPVVGRATTPDGARWLRVMLPGRPNGLLGWISQPGTVLATTSWHLVVRTASRRVLVYRLGHRVESFSAIVGKPSTPTPGGQFFVEESVLLPPGSPGAPFALALSARSDVLQEFDGGPGQIAIHGLANLGGTLGTAISHGCVRLADRGIRWLVAHIAPGVPVTVAA